MSDLCGHLFGGARRAVVLVRVGFGFRGGGAGGLGDAGNEPLDQLDRAFQGAAGVGADVFVGREGDHEASGGIAGSDGYGWGCCVMPSSE
jgi:phage-related minor tail protein